MQSHHALLSLPILNTSEGGNPNRKSLAAPLGMNMSRKPALAAALVESTFFDSRYEELFQVIENNIRLICLKTVDFLLHR
uniref:Uncharacterized protein n=1 Tax=Ixodes ricinus TaxID=34613 RepID=A0A6B0U1F5_IXORI